MSVQNTVGAGDRIVSFLTYLTAGWAGMIFMVILYFAKKNPSKFLRYNVFQSIFISLLYFVLCMSIGLICIMLLNIPYINAFISWFVLFFNKPVLMQYSVIQIFMIGLFFYMAIWSLFGKYPRVWKISSHIIDRAV